MFFAFIFVFQNKLSYVYHIYDINQKTFIFKIMSFIKSPYSKRANQNIEKLSNNDSEENLENTGENSCAKLEALYLKMVRKVQSQQIDIEYIRRSNRRRRQNLNEKECSLNRRQMLINEKKAKGIGPPQTDEELMEERTLLQKEIVELQSKLNDVIQQLKDGNIQFSQSSNSQILYADLQSKERTLKTKRRELTEKILACKQILSEPIDDVRLNEMVVSDLEDDVKLLQIQFNQNETENPVKSTEKLLTYVSQLENKNEARNRELITQQAKIDSLKKSIKPEKQISIMGKRKNITKVNFDGKIRNQLKKEEVSKLINNIITKLKDRQTKIEADDAAIDKLAQDNQLERVKIEKRYERKLHQIENIKSQIKAKEELQSNIHKLENSIENSTVQLEVLQTDRAQIERRIQNILRDKNYNSQKNQEHQKLVQSLSERTKDLQRNEDLLTERKKRIIEQDELLKQEEERCKEYQNKVEFAEHQIEDIEALNEDQISKIQQSSAEIEMSSKNFVEQHDLKSQNNLNLEIIEALSGSPKST